ncbi:UDP-N-acetylmuramoyl-L-alanyl-D-glutamate--2,6-diaminopimelate ligase [Magnetovibrio sp.]|uniref:UDP-N-acetylmuramoyl-L-alanyl-D-glutamate--2, 6-diaminopimelate ligase n=1 Tax=Magnetovibrio sp. TaxID=2024836 RepID=UPI002F93EEA3
MRLIEVLLGDEYVFDTDVIDGELDIAGLTCDSRAVRPGYLFAALPGAHVDGRDFIPAAAEKGAAIVLAPVGTRVDGIPVLEDANVRQRFARMAANFYRAQPAHVAAITGTNGKTSTASFLRQIWQRLGHKSASVGTLGVHGVGFDEPGKLTTPDPVQLHETLARLADAGVDHLAMEASSHGLEQFRLDGVRIQAAGFTNISRDHLDYHGTMSAYLAAKLRLFSQVVSSGGAAVINADSPEGHEITAVALKRGLRVLTYGREGRDIRLVDQVPHGDGQTLSVQIDADGFEVNLPLAGGFQAENALCALGLALAMGADVKAAVAALEFLDGVPGRLQKVGKVGGAAVYVDYAHTPDALQTVLQALRPHATGKLHVLFGCGGDRDAGKRPQMGAIAAKFADRVIVTDDNPRSEDPDLIRAEIMAACPSAREIGDRRQAIREAVCGLGDGDVLVLAGKGHEQGQIIGDEVRSFDDVAEAAAVMKEVGA